MWYSLWCTGSSVILCEVVMGLSGYEYFPRQGVGSFTGGGKKLLLHTTEGRSVSGAIVTLDKNRSWSHFLLSFEEKRKIQFIEIGQSAKSLSNDTSDGYQTNKANVVQVEICGLAREAGEWSTAKLDWLTECFSEIHLAWAFPLNTTSKDRMGDKQFVDYAGVCEHRNCPDNDHWDCGDLNVEYIVARMKNKGANMPSKEEINHIALVATGSLPGAGFNYDYFMNAPLYETLHAITGKDGMQGNSFYGRVTRGELIDKKDCPKTQPPTPTEPTCDPDKIAEAVYSRLKKQYNK